WTLAAALSIDLLALAIRLLLGAQFAVGNGAVIALAGLAAYTVWTRDARGLRSVCLGALLILATKAGDAWLQITTIVRPYVLD
ncbi:hypothetical protein QN361_25065, partial [Pseudomonas sp. 5C2]|nr:hypothetical protein [Pseudomonas sp. 5C2]